MTRPAGASAKRGPMVALVLGVLALVVSLAVARGRWLEPYLRHRAAERTVLRLEKENKLAEGLLLFQARRRHPTAGGRPLAEVTWDRCGMLVRGPAGWLVLDTAVTAGRIGLADWIAAGRGNRFSLERALGVGAPCRVPDREVVHRSP